MNLPTFQATLRDMHNFEYESMAEETAKTPLGIEPWTREMIVHHFDHAEPGWQARYQEAIRIDRERKVWARQFLADRDDYYRRDPEHGYSQADLRAEADSIRADERQMIRDRERDIVRGLGGIW